MSGPRRAEKSRRVLVTGAGGLLGPYLAEGFRSQCVVVTTSRRSGDEPADLTDPDAVRHLLDRTRPDVVLHAAAMTDVDECERRPADAEALNRRVPCLLAEQLPSSARLIIFSTDQVYPDRPGWHDEGSADPVNVYGRSKLEGEKAAEIHERTLVLRTNFFGPSQTPGRESLSDFVTRQLSHRLPTTLFADVLFSPLHLRTLVALTMEAVSADLEGTFNVGSRGGLSKLEFGLGVARHLELSTETVVAGRSDDVVDRAPRPHDLRMSVRRLEHELRTTIARTIDEIGLL